MRIGRLLRARRARPASLVPDRLDAWLEHLYGEQLTAIDAACAGGGPECFALFADLDTDLWALLLTQEYDAYPHIRALLPSVPDARCRSCGTAPAGSRWPPRARRSMTGCAGASRATATAPWPTPASWTSGAAGAG